MKETGYQEPEPDNQNVVNGEEEVYVFPASFGQRRFWFLDQYEPNSPYYNIPSAFRLRGPLNLDLFLKAIDDIVKRHESLRTTFNYIDDETVQIIYPELKIKVPVIDLTDLHKNEREQEIMRRATAEARKPFNLKTGPLLRITILKVSTQDHVILLTMHHIISDGWSIGVIVAEISALYDVYSNNKPSPLPELPLQYADYAEWQNEYMKGETLTKQLEYWKSHLGTNPPVLELPTDRPRPLAQSSSGDSVSLDIPADVMNAIKHVGQKEGATLFMTMLTAFKILLSRFSGQYNISVGTPIANRTQGETEGLIGLFINTLVLRTDFSPDISAMDLIKQVKSTTLDAYEHQDLPFEYLVDSLQTDRDISNSPLFQVMFILQNAPVNIRQVSDLTMESLEVNMGTSTFDLTLSVVESIAGINLTAEFNTDLFDKSSIERLLRNFRQLLNSIIQNPDTSVSLLAILPETDLHQITKQWNQTETDFSTQATIHGLFEQSAALVPEAIAVISSESQLSYKELNERANQLAHALISKGVGPESKVGLSMERSINMVISLFGILKTGAAYLPLDPNYPKERLSYIIKDADIATLITQKKLVDRFGHDTLDIICLDRDWDELIATRQVSNPEVAMYPQNAAYIIYTSGSTGIPKGVIITHRSVINHNQSVTKLFDLNASDRMLQFATINFDAAVEEIFPTLNQNATLVLRGTDILLSGTELLHLIREHKLTILDLPTAYWHQWVNELSEQEIDVPASLKLVILGGDKASADHVATWNRIGGSLVRLLNTYGPTETTIISTAYEVSEKDRANDAPVELPIGRPIGNTFAYILDAHLQVVPVGVPGELHIGGEGLARAYLNRPDQTAASFIPDPFSKKAGRRLYKTGDLVKYRPDGQIEFVGRVDFQVKIRGFRVELGEIENAVLYHENIIEVVVLASSDGPGEKQIFAYCVAAGGMEVTSGQLREYLRKSLPDYMIPAVFIFLQEMPLTENGKIDRKALPKPDQQIIVDDAETEFVAPRTPTEEVVANLCAEVLGLDKIGVLHNFFEMGGHSLLATQLISRINKTFNIEVALRKIFENPTMAGLALATDEAKHRQAGMDIPAIKTVGRDQDIPLSFAQHRLWFLDQLEPNSPFYNLPETYRLSGSLQVDILERAINEVIRRHESLRTYIISDAGNPIQKIEESFEYKIQINDISSLPAAEREKELLKITHKRALKPISLTQLPLFNLELVKLGEDDHAIILIMHHIISDNWSSRILMSEMAVLYNAFLNNDPSPLQELPLQYADFAYWQRNWLQGEVLEQQLAYWKKQLSDAPPALEMPTDRPRPARQTFNGSFKQFYLSEDVSAKIKKLAHEQGATLFMTLLAAFKVLLYRYSGQDDISIGTPIANRNRSEIENLIGFFVNTLVIRNDLSGNPTFIELIRRIKETALGAYAYQDLPFEKIVDTVQPERDMSHSPLFQVMFALQTSGGATMQTPGKSALTLSPIEAHSNTSKFDLTLFMLEDQNRLGGALEYNTDLFDASTIERIIDHFSSLIERLAENPQLSIGNVPMLEQQEKQNLLVNWNGQPRALHFTDNIITIFEEQAAQNPDHIAVDFEGQTRTYKELNASANQVAHHLRGLGIGADSLVGISIKRSPEMITAMLAVLKAGGAYVPVDPSNPQDRIKYILDDSGVSVLLATEDIRKNLPDYNGQTVLMDTAYSEFVSQSKDNLNISLDPDNLAFMIYTSGSTGKPKGTLITHRGLTNYLNWTFWAYPLESGKGSLVHSTIAFDATVTAVFTPLLTGKTITLIPDNSDLEALSKMLLTQKNFNIVKITPAHLDMLSQQIPAEQAAGLVNAFIIGGENLTAEQVRFWQENAPQTKLFNEYGPTETVVGCVIYEAAGWRGEGSVPIGRAIPNTQVYILNEYLEPVPAGASGELYIGGEGVARGYLNRPDLTAECFIPDPFSGKQGSRLYKTGDLVKYLPDGQMEFLSRVDNQVKIRGYRIELGEIEAALSEHEALGDVVVLAREDKPADRRLVAYFLCDMENPPSSSELRDYLKDHLPEYMIPSVFMHLEAFPLTVNGKVDRKALPKPDFSRPDLEGEFVSPRTSEEQQLADIWKDILNVEQVGIYDSFFELGGHSLIATQLISRIRETFNVELELRALFESPTILGLIHEIDKTRLSNILPAAPPLEKAPRDRAIPVSFAQQRLWFLDQLSPDNAFYNLPSAMRLIGNLDISVLENTVQEITRRHEILRTTFAYVDGQAVQVIDPDFKSEIEITDLTTLSAEAIESTAIKMATEEAQESFDLELGPLFRVKLLKTSENEHVILYTMHHIISDGWSVNVLMREVAVLYESFSKNLHSPLPKLPVQYADFAIWQREWLKDDILEKQINYWKEKIGLNPPMLSLPTDKPRPAVQTFNGDTFLGMVPLKISEQINELGRKEGATLFMTLLAAFQTLIFRYSNQEEFLLGSPIAARNHLETENLIGFFVNTLVLKADFSTNPTFIELLGLVRETTLGAFSNQDLPFEQLVEILQPERDMSHSPLFQVMFVLQNTPPPRGVSLSDIRMEPVQAKDKTAKFDLSFVIMESAEGFGCEFEFNTDLFQRPTIERMFNHFTALLEQIIKFPQKPLEELPLLNENELKLITFEWNRTAHDFPKEKCIHQLFEKIAAKSPNAKALVFEDNSLTYSELNERANQLAHFLREQGSAAEQVVGISVSRSFDLVIGLLGILKAGAVYLPIDPAYPQERIEYILNDSKVNLLLTNAETEKLISLNNVNTIHLDSEWQKIETRDKMNPVNITFPENMAYIIYTSGSTGRPKGTMLQHRGLVNLTRSLSKNYKVGQGSRCLQFASFSFDASVEEIFTALTNGATLYLIKKEILLSGTGLVNTLQNNKISNVTLPPSVLSVLDSKDFPDLTTIVSAGEACSREITEKWAPGRHFVNGYGPTENTVCSIVNIVQSTVETNNVPIGKAIDNVSTYILDKYLHPVPVGIPGELHLGGIGLARGYLNRPELTAEKFIPNPFSEESDSRLYKTGDLARYIPDSNIEFLGRIDQQVKVRGFRIELGEVEAFINEQEHIKDAVVLAKKISEGDQRLIAYIISEIESGFDLDQLKETLKSQMPDYMIPSVFIQMENFPVTPNGKIDYRALPQPEIFDSAKKSEYVKPQNTTQARLAAIWEELLNTRPIGIKDNFFDLGGHSLLAMRLLTQIEQQFKKSIQLITLFQEPTIEHLAKVLTDEEESKTTAKLIEMQIGGSKPPLYFVHPSGGSVHFYSELVKYLDPAYPFYGIQAKGMDGKEDIDKTIEAMASTYVNLILEKQPQGPYYLGSYSFGVIVVYEMARQLTAIGHEVAMLIQFDQTPTIDHKMYDDTADMLAQMFQKYFTLDVNHLRTLETNQQFKYVLKKAKKIKILPRFIKTAEFQNNVLMNETQSQAWMRYKLTSYAGSLTLFKSEENKDHKKPDLGWSDFVTGKIDIIDVPGDHLSMLKEPHVQTLADKLNKRLDENGYRAEEKS